MHDEVVVGLFELLIEQTLSAKLEIKHIGDTNVDNPEKALVALLEFLLIKDLDSNNGRIGDIDIKAVVPVRVQGLLDDRGGVRLLSVHSDNCERVREAKNIALCQAISSNDGNANLSRERTGASRIHHCRRYCCIDV